MIRGAAARLLQGVIWGVSDLVTGCHVRRLAVARELLPILSNLAQVFLKRGDFGNVVKALDVYAWK